MCKEIEAHLLPQLSPEPLQPERFSYENVVLLSCVWPLVELTKNLSTLGKMMQGLVEEKRSCCAVKTPLEVEKRGVVKGGVKVVAWRMIWAYSS